MKIEFHIPTIMGSERQYLDEILTHPGSIASDGRHSAACAGLLQEHFGFDNVLFTPSCTAALEIAALLTVQPGDEVIVPSFTFVTSISPFVNAGAKPVFCDIRPDTLNLDERRVEELITPRTRVIVVVHYGGVSADMDAIADMASTRDIRIVEDAAQALSGTYRDRPLGSLGDLSCLSFHSTKNYQCGEGGALIVNNSDYMTRAEILREKGTNRRAFVQGRVDKYTWVDRGSSYIPSELSMAFLRGQLEHVDEIRQVRQRLYERYQQLLRPLADEGLLSLPVVPGECGPSYHLIYVLLSDAAAREGLQTHLSDADIGATFHYVPLHTSPAGGRLHDGRQLPVTESVHARLLRLPLYPDLADSCVETVCNNVYRYFGRSL